MRAALAAILVASCGRVGFDDRLASRDGDVLFDGQLVNGPACPQLDEARGGREITVTNATELRQAVLDALPNDTLLLAPAITR